MPHFRDLIGDLHFIEDLAFEYMLPAGSVQCTEDDEKAIVTQNAAAMQMAALQGQAYAALARSDNTVLRCVERGVVVPQAWINHRELLRMIVSTGAGELPVEPPYPEGT